jgi:hypothetical protein
MPPLSLRRSERIRRQAERRQSHKAIFWSTPPRFHWKRDELSFYQVAIKDCIQQTWKKALCLPDQWISVCEQGPRRSGFTTAVCSWMADATVRGERVYFHTASKRAAQDARTLVPRCHRMRPKLAGVGGPAWNGYYDPACTTWISESYELVGPDVSASVLYVRYNTQAWLRC